MGIKTLTLATMLFAGVANAQPFPSSGLQLTADSFLFYGGSASASAAINSTAVTAAQAQGGFINVPVGTYTTNTGNTTFIGPYLGPGKFLDSGGNPRAPELAEIGSAPTWTPSDANSIVTWQKGNWSKTFPAWEYWITGAATLGQPTSGYLYTDPATPREGYLYNSSGWNNGTADNAGRTGAVAYRTHLFQAGQGDAVAYNCTGFASSQRAGATNFLASPAVSCVTGDLTAGAAGQYLDADEIIMSDGGFDVAAIGIVRNFTRTNVTGALGAYWAGVRIQSKGAGAIDAAFSSVGPINIILDATTATLGANKSAITLSAGQRIYLNAANVDANQNPSATTVGTVYIDYETSPGAIVVEGKPLIQGKTKFTTTGCSVSATTGSGTAGTYTSGTTGTCAVVITMNGATGLTAPNGWHCSASDRNTPANLQSTSASTTTTCTITGTTVSGDVVSFAATPY